LNLDNPLIFILLFFLFFIGIFFVAKNEHITNIDQYINKNPKIILYNVKIVNWRTYNEINFIAKAKKIYNPFYSKYLYSQEVEIYKPIKKELILIYAPYLEIYTNLFSGKSNNIKSIIKKDESITTIYTKEAKIKNKNIDLSRNIIYHKSKDVIMKIYYPKMEIYLDDSNRKHFSI